MLCILINYCVIGYLSLSIFIKLCLILWYDTYVISCLTHEDLRVPYFHLCHLSGNPHFGSNGMGAGPCVALFHGFELRQNE